MGMLLRSRVGFLRGFLGCNLLLFAFKKLLKVILLEFFMNYNEGLSLLKKYICDPNVIIHSKGVSDFAYDLAKKIRKHSRIKLDIKKVHIAGLLHDIGKTEHAGHEERSLEILKKEGLHNIAKISIHGLLRNCSDLSYLNDIEHVENKIITYSDMRFKFSPMTVKERFDEAITGWNGSEEAKRKRRERLEKSVLSLENELLELAGGYI